MNSNESLLFNGQIIHQLSTGYDSFIESWAKLDEKYKGHSMYLIHLKLIDKDLPETKFKISDSFLIDKEKGITLIVTKLSEKPGAFIASFGFIKS